MKRNEENRVKRFVKKLVSKIHRWIDSYDTAFIDPRIVGGYCIPPFAECWT